MKTSLILAAAAASVLPGAASAQRVPPATVLVVDTNRVLSQCTACVAATQALQGMESNFNQRRQALLTPLQTEEQSLAQAAQALQNQTGAARASAENALRPRVESFNQRRQSAGQELQTLQQNFESTRINVSRQLNQRLDPIYTQIMNARGANLVISTDAQLAHAPAIDVTNEVLAALNQQLPSVSITPLPQQPGVQQPGQQPRPQGR